MKISQRTQSLKPSPTIALATKAKELKAEGKDVISLTVGEPDWSPFDSIKQAAVKAIQDNAGRYTPVTGIPALRQAIVAATKQDTGLDYQDNQVTSSAGGKFIIYSAIQAIIDPGDEVIIPAPYWVSYPSIVELAQGTPVVVSTKSENNFKITAQELAASITEKTQLLILNSPSNPTGFMYSEDEFKQLAEVLSSHPHVRVLCDDIYNRLVFDGNIAPHLLKVAPELKDRTLVMNGVAKSFAMTGWRVGWALGHTDWIKAMNKLQSQTVTCASEISQIASAEALNNCLPQISESVEVLKERVGYFVEELNQLGLETTMPEGAFYVWPDLKNVIGKSYKGQRIANSQEFCSHLLSDFNVATVPGSAFGCEGYLRMSYAVDISRLKDAIDRLKTYLSKMN